MTYRHLLVTRSDDRRVVTVTLNRPEQMNAMNTGMGEDLLACFDSFPRDPDVRAVVFTGAGDRAFCAGGDLKERNAMTDEAWRAQHVIFEQAAFRVLRCPVPVIAAVEGFALAGGCELAVLSDFIVASETAVFGVPETTLGIFPGIGGTQLLPRIIGAPLAKELIFTGRRMRADEAKAVGLVNHMVPAGQARATATQIAITIAKNGPIAVRQAKKAIAYGAETDLDTAMILAIEAYNATIVTEDRLEDQGAVPDGQPGPAVLLRHQTAQVSGLRQLGDERLGVLALGVQLAPVLAGVALADVVYAVAERPLLVGKGQRDDCHDVRPSRKAGYLPWNLGLRFSLNARTPSRRSCVTTVAL